MANSTKEYKKDGVLIAERFGYFDSPSFSLVSYYPNNKIRQEIKTIKNVKHFFDIYNVCILKTYDEDGHLDIMAEAFLYNPFNLVLNGQLKKYYPNGHLKFVVNYVGGVRQGKMEFFYDNGDTEMILNYIDGDPVEGLICSPQGEVKQLTIAHINNIMNDYDVGKIKIDLSWGHRLHGIWGHF